MSQANPYMTFSTLLKSIWQSTKNEFFVADISFLHSFLWHLQRPNVSFRSDLSVQLIPRLHFPQFIFLTSKPRCFAHSMASSGLGSESKLNSSIFIHFNCLITRSEE